MGISKIFTAVILFVALFAGCTKQDHRQLSGDTSRISAAPIKEGQGKGVLRGMDTAAKNVTLDHGNVPNVMEAMTMDYHVEHSEALRGLAVGDSVSFTLQDRGEGNFVVTTITPIKK